MLSSVVCSLVLGFGIAGDRFTVAAAPSKPDAALLSKRGSKRTGEGKGVVVTVKKEPGTSASNSKSSDGSLRQRLTARLEGSELPVLSECSSPRPAVTIKREPGVSGPTSSSQQLVVVSPPVSDGASPGADVLSLPPPDSDGGEGPASLPASQEDGFYHPPVSKKPPFQQATHGDIAGLSEAGSSKVVFGDVDERTRARSQYVICRTTMRDYTHDPANEVPPIYRSDRLDEFYFCSCPAWKYQKAALDKRECKHIRKEHWEGGPRGWWTRDGEGAPRCGKGRRARGVVLAVQVTLEPAMTEHFSRKGRHPNEHSSKYL
eukprot:g19494.t1